MAISTKYDDGDIVSDINMTPLIDVMLVLLIIFMVTSSAAVESGLTVNLPESAATGATPPSSLIISMNKTGEVAVAGKTVTKDQLGAAVKEELTKLKTTSVVLEGDGDLTLTNTISVIDIARAAGAVDFSIAAKVKAQ
jgi:biopolymer transport protein ExbD